MALRTHCQTSGWSLTAQDPYNNVTRTCIEAFAAAAGHTQSLHTNALDEAIALPTDFSAKIARDTQLYLQRETDICKVVDPWGGSYYVEHLTDLLIKKSWKHFQEIEALGGMTKAIEKGVPQSRIEEASAVRQARIDSEQEVIVGLNKYCPEQETPLEILTIDNSLVREAQIQRLQKLRENRNEHKCQDALNAITNACANNDGNLLELAVEAAKARASLGEISYAMEKVFGRYKSQSKLISGTYRSAYKNPHLMEKILKIVKNFEAKEGRRPRILIAKMGQDGHDRGAKVIATAFADMGFDVDLGPLFQTPEETAKQAAENDVHLIAMSTLAGGHKTLLPALIDELKKLARQDILVVCGGVIPSQDHPFLLQNGASAVFGPGTKIPQAAEKLLELLLERS